MIPGLLVMDAIELLRLESSDLTALLAIIFLSARNATVKIRLIFINSQEKRSLFRISLPRTVET
jgi:hypothetical protein